MLTKNDFFLGGSLMPQFKKQLYQLILFLFIALPLSAVSKPYVILISFDGFRWDYLNRGITPNLQFIKDNGVSALSLKPCFPSKTFPNHYTIVTGMYPENHGIIANNFYDPFTKEKYSISDTAQVRNPKWYNGMAIWETAKRQGIITASYFWPGSEVNLEYRRPNYFENYEHARPYETRIKGVLDWLTLPGSVRPHFITLYFDAADTYGHKFGPNSEELNNSLMRLDSLVGKLLTGLTEIGLRDSTDLIFVSDHGMTEVSSERIINIEKLLPKFNCKFFNNGPLMFIFPKDEEKEFVFNKLKNLQKNFKVYKKSELPEYFHFSHNSLIPDILIIADAGWTLISNKDERWIKSSDSKGNHGYDPNYLDMHGIFLAIGPSFKQGYFTGTINNIDIYPLLAKILNVVPNNNIDGKLERIEFLLK